AVDDVHRGVLGGHVAAEDGSVLVTDRPLLASTLHLDGVTVEGGVGAADLVRAELALDDVVGEDLGQHRLVGEQVVQGLLVDLGERVVGGGEDGDRLGLVEGGAQVGGGDRGDQGLEQRVAGGGGGDRLGRHLLGGAGAGLRERVARGAEGTHRGGRLV